MWDQPRPQGSLLSCAGNIVPIPVADQKDRGLWERDWCMTRVWYASLKQASFIPGLLRSHWKSSKWPMGIRIGNLENQAVKLTLLSEFGFSLFLSSFFFLFCYFFGCCCFVCLFFVLFVVILSSFLSFFFRKHLIYTFFYVTLRKDLTTLTRKLHNAHTTLSKGHTFCVTHRDL